MRITQFVLLARIHWIALSSLEQLGPDCENFPLISSIALKWIVGGK